MCGVGVGVLPSNPVKTSEQDRRSPRVGGPIYALGGWCTPVPRGQKPLCPGPFWILPYAPLYPAVLYKFLRSELVTLG